MIRFAGYLFRSTAEAADWVARVVVHGTDEQLRETARAAGLEPEDARTLDSDIIAEWLGDVLRAEIEQCQSAESSAADLETLVQPLPGGRIR